MTLLLLLGYEGEEAAPRRRREERHGTYFISKEGFPRRRLLERHKEDDELLELLMLMAWMDR